MISNIKSKHIMLIKIIFTVTVIIFILSIAFIHAFGQFEKKYSTFIYPNVFIDGKSADGKSKGEFAADRLKKDSELQTKFLTVYYANSPIATFSAQTLNLHSNINEIADRAYLVGRTEVAGARLYQKVTTFLRLVRYNFYSHISYDKGPLTEFLNDTATQFEKPARNALFKFDQGKVVNFRPEENGLSLHSEDFIKDVDILLSKLSGKSNNLSITLRSQTIKPDITLAQSNQFGIEELIAVGNSNYAGSIPGRVHNIILAASKFNGVLIPKGETLSFGNAVGDISALTGYQQAYIIKDGKTVLGDGGGVCQVSSTLFRAALNAGLPLLERTAHAYRVHYYENDSQPGFDATVFAPSVDLKIKNDTPEAILVETEINEDKTTLIFKLYGKKDGRKVTVSQSVVYDQQPPPPDLRQDDPTLKKGVVKQVDFPAWGAKAKFHYNVVRDGVTLQDQDFYSIYRAWQGIYLVGTAN